MYFTDDSLLPENQDPDHHRRTVGAVWFPGRLPRRHSGQLGRSGPEGGGLL